VVPTGPVRGFTVIEGVATVKVAETVLTPSLAVTVWAPGEEAGTVKVMVNAPVPEEVVVVMVVASNFVVMVEEDRKFEPVTVTKVPSGPLLGFRVIKEGVTVKAAEAELPPESVPTTGLAPADETGTLKRAPENEPVASVLVVPVSVTGLPANVAVIVEDAAKPVPDTVTEVPVDPMIGFRVIDAVTVKVADPELSIASVAVTVWEPAVEAGTANMTLTVPVPEVVVVMVVASNFIVTVELAAKPEPVTVTVAPTRPEVGFKAIIGVTVRGSHGLVAPALLMSPL
jgi:hypothetical protein